MPVHDLVVHPRERELVAGTHGRSIWIVDVLPIQDLAQSGEDTALKVFYIDDVKASRYWRGKRSRWYYKADEAPKSIVKYWSDSAGEASIEILDKNNSVVRRLGNETQKGMNSFEWDLRVEQDLALAAESAALEKATEDSADKESADSTLADTPYAESVRLGHDLYAIPGDYTVRVTLGENIADSKLKIKAPKAYEPRVKETYNLRGKKD